MIKYFPKAVLIFSVFSFSVSSLWLSAASASLSSYEATFEVIPNKDKQLRDVQVELKLTYSKRNELPERDMKSIAAQAIDAVEVIDGKGKPLSFKVNRGEKTSTIIWNLTSVTKKNREVIVRFRLPQAITLKGKRNIFGAYWVGGLEVPVEKALYRFIFPVGYSYQECSVYPKYDYEEKIENGKKQITIAMAPLKGESLALAFAPVFEQGEPIPDTSVVLLEKGGAAGDEIQDKAKVSHHGKGEVEKEDVREGAGKNDEAKQVVAAKKIAEEKKEAVETEQESEESILVVSSSTTTTRAEDKAQRLEEEAPHADALRVYNAARELYEQEKFSEALATLRYFMDTYARSVLSDDVSFLMGECYVRLAEQGVFGSYQPAVDAFQLALALYPDSPHASLGLFQMANSLRKMGYHFEAQENYQLLIDNYPRSKSVSDARFWIAETHFQSDEFREAKDLFRYFIVKYPRNDNVRRATFRVADCYVGLKEYGKAEEAYKEAVDRWPLYSGLFPETLYSLGLTYLRNKHYSKARSVLFMALNIFPEEEYNHIIVTKIGDTYREEGKVEQALTVYSQNGVLYPESRGAMISEIKMADLGVTNPGFFNFVQYLEPLQVYQKAIDKYPATDLAGAALYKEGRALAEQKRYQEAISSLMTVLQEYPDSELSEKCFYSLQKNLAKLIDSYFFEEHYYPILEVYQQYAEPFLAEIKDTKTLFQIGESFRQAGLYNEALELYGKAKRIYPPNHPEDELTFRVGGIYLKQKEYAKAEKLFKKVIDTFPESTIYRSSFHSLADTYFEQERYDEAYRAYLAALESGTKSVRDVKSLFRLGRCYQAMGEETLAVDTYKRTIRVAEGLGPDQAADTFIVEGYFTLADFLYQIQWYSDAIRVYTEIIERFPEEERAQWALYRIAASYRKAGKGNAEIESLKQFADAGGNDTFWKKVASEHIRNLEWEIKNRDYLRP